MEKLPPHPTRIKLQIWQMAIGTRIFHLREQQQLVNHPRHLPIIVRLILGLCAEHTAYWLCASGKLFLFTYMRCFRNLASNLLECGLRCSEGKHKNRRFYVCGMKRESRCEYIGFYSSLGIFTLSHITKFTKATILNGQTMLINKQMETYKRLQDTVKH